MMAKSSKRLVASIDSEANVRGLLASVAVAKKHAGTALAADKAVGKGHKRLSVEERGRHQKALKAAIRTEKRLKAGKAPSRETVTKPGKTKAKSTPESRRKPFEALLPGDSARKLRGVKDLISAGREAKKGG